METPSRPRLPIPKPTDRLDVGSSRPTLPAAPKTAARPFRWTGLPQVSRAEVQLLRSVEGVLLTHPEEALAQLNARFKALFELETQVELHHLYLATPAQLLEQIPEPACLRRLALAPHLPRGVLEVELALAHAAIDQLLGGSAGESVILRALTDVEEGVLDYVLAEGLRALSVAVDPSRPRLRLEGSLASREDAQALVEEEANLLVLQLTLSLGEAASGYFRLFLPGSALRTIRSDPESTGFLERRAARLASHSTRLQHMRGPAWVEIGHCDLTTGELRGLAAGDVVLVEEVTARPDRGEGGTGRLKIGQGQRGSWSVQLAFEKEAGLRATLEQLEIGSPAPPERASQTTDPEDPPAVLRTSEVHIPEGEDLGDLPEQRPAERTEPPGPRNPWDEPEHTTVSPSAKDARLEAPELLNDIPLHVAVELGRVRLGAEEIVAMRPGQVIAIGKGPGDGVDLSVNGKIVAHGELVEIEGQLGVRLTAVVG